MHDMWEMILISWKDGDMFMPSIHVSVSLISSHKHWTVLWIGQYLAVSCNSFQETRLACVLCKQAAGEMKPALNVSSGFHCHMMIWTHLNSTFLLKCFAKWRHGLNHLGNAFPPEFGSLHVNYSYVQMPKAISAVLPSNLQRCCWRRHHMLGLINCCLSYQVLIFYLCWLMRTLPWRCMSVNEAVACHGSRSLVKTNWKLTMW